MRLYKWWKQQNQQQLVAMDPRPYHFEYRRPRYSNPTFQSLKLYESIYQMDGFRKANPEHRPSNATATKPVQDIPRLTPQSEPDKMQRHQSSDLRQLARQDRYSRDNSAPKNSQKLNSSMSQYGNHLMKAPLLDQNRIFQKQEKQYNIISYRPKAYTPRLKNFPRLTLEDQLFERKGSFDKQD